MTPEERVRTILADIEASFLGGKSHEDWAEDSGPNVTLASRIVDAVRAAVAEEREACAKMVDDEDHHLLAAAIRARGAP